MTKTVGSQSSASPEVLMHSMEEGRLEAAHAWSRVCTLYSRYFAELAKADTPAAILQANVDLLSKGMEAMGKSVSAFQNIAAPTPPAKH